MKNKIDMVNAWYKFDVGDNLSDNELLACITETKDALKYLSNRGLTYKLATRATQDTLYTLESYARERGLNIPD